MSPVIETQGLVKTYQQGEKPLTVLKGVDLVIEAGEFAALSAHGSVKSTGNPR